MEIEFTKILIEQAIKVFITKGLDFFKKDVSNKPLEYEKFKSSFSSSIVTHMVKVLNFSDKLSNSKLSEPKKTEDFTIQLTVKPQIRKYTSPDKKVRDLSELEVLYGGNHCILLGDPGAGKTTTLKRLIQKCYLDLIANDSKVSFYPVLIRLGEIERGQDLFLSLAKELGISYTTITREIEHENELFDIEEIDLGELKSKKLRVVEYKVGDLFLENALACFFNETQVILFLDGLDEIHFDLKDKIYKQIKSISYLLSGSKIILTSRPFSDVNSFQSFSKFEIQPLTKEQSIEIANYWIHNPSDFFEILYSKPYKDLANRPLFLNYLLVLFENSNDELPNQAIEVYRQIILLAIKEWDENKEYKTFRYSKYKWFNTFQKEDFLSELAFNLTYKLKIKKVFTQSQMISAFVDIYKRYEKLTLDDAKSVIDDIEAHNGLIINSYSNTYEFSHLSLQEYLCGKYILSIPFSKENYDYLNEYPAPLAIANVLSPRPAEWFSALILNYQNQIQIDRNIKPDKIFEFLDRLIIEQITFLYPTIELGYSIIYLLSEFRFQKQVLDLINRFLLIRCVMDSLVSALQKYSIVDKDLSNNLIILELSRPATTDLEILVPKNVTLNLRFISDLIKKYSITIHSKK